MKRDGSKAWITAPISTDKLRNRTVAVVTKNHFYLYLLLYRVTFCGEIDL